MSGGRLIKRARRAAGITQAELARRMGTKQPVVARWENGARDPSYSTVLATIEACGFELEGSLRPIDLQEEATLAHWLRMSPRERLEANRAMIETERWARRARRVRDGREVHYHAYMRTTVEIRDDQRAALAALAARRGRRGFSDLIQEAIDLYLSHEGSGDVEAALALEGVLSEGEAEELERRIGEAWSSWATAS